MIDSIRDLSCTVSTIVLNSLAILDSISPDKFVAYSQGGSQVRALSVWYLFVP
jgi:hypothetical protein